jgi:hypothetical protein
MNKTIPVRNRPANASVLALVIALSLLVAPVCAPLCAASACSSGAHQNQCHKMSAIEASGAEHLVAPSKACGAADFSAVLVKANEQSWLSQQGQNDPAPAVRGVSSGHALGNLEESLGRFGLHRVPLKSQDLLLLTTILRM